MGDCRALFKDLPVGGPEGIRGKGPLWFLFLIKRSLQSKKCF